MKTKRPFAAAAALAHISATTLAGDICDGRTNPASPYNRTNTGSRIGNTLRVGGLRLFETGGASGVAFNIAHLGTLTLLGNVEPTMGFPSPAWA